MKHNPVIVPSMTLRPGMAIAAMNLDPMVITKIEQKEHDKFELTCDDQGGRVISVDTRGYDRIPEPEPDYSTGTARRRLVDNVESLPVELFDILTIPELGSMAVHQILHPREDRYQITLAAKRQFSVIVDIYVPSTTRGKRS